MKTSLNRRDWFKSSMAITAGMSLTSSLAAKLMAAPVSKAEESFIRKASQYKIRLDSNENPYGPSAAAMEAIRQIVMEANRYPFLETDELKAMIAAKEGVTPSHIQIGAGSGDILCQTGAAFGVNGGRVLSAFPTFSLLMDYAHVFNATWDKINVNENYEHDLEAIAAAIKSDTRLIFICNPNNPTGTFIDPLRVKAFCEEASKKTPVYVDEAYLEFLEPAQQISMVDLVRQNKDVIVSRTFSKIHGMAGLRIGYIVAKPELIRKIARYEHDIPVSNAAIAAAKVSLGNEDFMTLTRTKTAEARSVLTGYLDSKKISYAKTVTNFVFFPAPKDGKLILTKMEEKGYLMRIWDFKQREYCRVSVGTFSEMKGFVKAFNEVIS